MLVKSEDPKSDEDWPVLSANIPPDAARSAYLEGLLGSETPYRNVKALDLAHNIKSHVGAEEHWERKGDLVVSHSKLGHLGASWIAGPIGRYDGRSGVDHAPLVVLVIRHLDLAEQSVVDGGR